MFIITSFREQIDIRFEAIAHNGALEAPQLASAAKYVAESGGKRLRGLFTAALAWDLGFRREADLLALAVSLEAVHAASLVHDDLPALDNDDLRRGRPSCHKVFGEATAILTGDYLFGVAFKLIVDTTLADEQKMRLTRHLSETWISLCVGQQLDLTGTSDTQRARMLELKTGALFGCAAAWGCVAAGGAINEADRFRAWGDRLGVLFQKLDDRADGDGEMVSHDAIIGETESIRGEMVSLLGSASVATAAVFERVVHCG